MAIFGYVYKIESVQKVIYTINSLKQTFKRHIGLTFHQTFLNDFVEKLFITEVD